MLPDYLLASCLARRRQSLSKRSRFNRDFGSGNQDMVNTPVSRSAQSALRQLYGGILGVMQKLDRTLRLDRNHDLV